MIFESDPYEGFDYKAVKRDMQGWGSYHPVFEAAIKAIRPKLIVEVGTWKGASAIHMADLCKKLDLDTKILCIDTWLGTIESYTWRKKEPLIYNALNLKNGYPSLYYQFLANVCHTGFQDRILPLAQTSLIGARILHELGIKPDMIYVDGSHDYSDVKADLAAYFPLLRKGGLMLGDDFESWGGVTRAVREFAFEAKTLLMGMRGKFAIAKEACVLDVFGAADLVSPAGDVAGLRVRV